MNDNPMQSYQQHAVAEHQPDMQAPYATHTANMLMNPQIMQALDSFANMMAGGVATVPQHLRKNKADCMAVVMQAAQWGMNPFAVAQKTHLTQGGQLGYEAQLVNAVITSNGPFDGRQIMSSLATGTRFWARCRSASQTKAESIMSQDGTLLTRQVLASLSGHDFAVKKKPASSSC